MNVLVLLLLLGAGAAEQVPPAAPVQAAPVQAAPETAATWTRLAEEALAFAEGEAARLPGSYSIRLVQPPALPVLPRGDLRIESLRLSKGEPTGHFFVTAKLLVEGRAAGFARIDLEGTWNGQLVRARESLPRRAVPDATQLESTPFQGTPPPGALTAFPEGMRLRQPVSAGKVLTRSDLELIPLVLAGERVRLVASVPGLTILAEATARSTGGQGERVRVEVGGSRRLVQAVVSGQSEVRLAGTDPGK